MSKKKIIKTEEQARDFIMSSLLKHLNHCSDQICPEHVGVLNFLFMGGIICENFGKEAFEELVKEVRRARTDLENCDPEDTDKNKWH